MKKGLLVLLCIAMAGMVLGGCSMRSASGTTATTAPMATNSPMTTAQAAASPNAPMTNGEMADMQENATNGSMTTANGSMATANGSMATADGAMTSMSPDTTSGASWLTPAQAGKMADQIEEALERFSEIDDAEVALSADWRVLVGVEFDDQYKAGLDDRMKNMIVEAIQKVDDGLTKIEITDDGTLYGQVKGLGEKLAKATGLDELADDFGDLWDRVTGM